MDKITINLSFRKELNVTLNQYAVLELIAESQWGREWSEIKYAELADKIGLTERTMGRVFQILRSKGLVETYGQSKRLIGTAKHLLMHETCTKPQIKK